jgi:hypothetical protein
MLISRSDIVFVEVKWTEIQKWEWIKILKSGGRRGLSSVAIAETMRSIVILLVAALACQCIVLKAKADPGSANLWSDTLNAEIRYACEDFLTAFAWNQDNIAFKYAIGDANNYFDTTTGLLNFANINAAIAEFQTFVTSIAHPNGITHTRRNLTLNTITETEIDSPNFIITATGPAQIASANVLLGMVQPRLAGQRQLVGRARTVQNGGAGSDSFTVSATFQDKARLFTQPPACLAPGVPAGCCANVFAQAGCFPTGPAAFAPTNFGLAVITSLIQIDVQRLYSGRNVQFVVSAIREYAGFDETPNVPFPITNMMVWPTPANKKK